MPFSVTRVRDVRYVVTCTEIFAHFRYSGFDFVIDDWDVKQFYDGVLWQVSIIRKDRGAQAGDTQQGARRWEVAGCRLCSLPHLPGTRRLHCGHDA
jgi:hypothetical protein